jgi:MFS family permease
MEPQQDQKSAYIIIALISIPIFIGAIDLTVVSAVLPQVIYDLEIPLQTGLDDAAWIVTGYLLVYSVAMMLMGRLSDIYGRRKTYLVALFIFAVGSLMVAVSDIWLTEIALRIYYTLGGIERLDISNLSLTMIIISRMIQAFGGGAMVPVGMALVGDLFPAGRRARAIGVIAAIDTAGWVIGHLYGGIVVRFFDWRMIFWLNLPICILGFIVIYIMLRKVPQPLSKIPMDWLGAFLVTGFLCALNIGLGSGSEVNLSAAEQTTTPPYNINAIIIAGIFLILFIMQQWRSRRPLIELALFRNRNFASASLTNFLVGASLFIAIANVPLYINSLVAETLEQGAWDSGWMLSALTVPIALASIPGGWLTERRGYRLPSIAGLFLAILGFALMSRWEIDTTYAAMAPHLVLAGIGLGLTIAPIATAVVNAASKHYRGIASALVLTFRLIGMTVGVSSMTTYGLHRADFLTATLIPPNADYYEALNTSMSIMMKVINETFLIAGAICILAIIPAILLGKDT